MHPERRSRLSRFLSLVLRHRPEQVGVLLDGQGRVALETLLPALHQHGWDDLNAGDVEEVVHSDGRRFELQDGMIRARYGHSVPLEQPAPPARPPEWLYYAVPDDEMGEVRDAGLRPGTRRLVHLCATPADARRILERHGATGTLITITARQAHDRGLPFFRATEGLFLVPDVPSEFLLFL